MATNRGSAPEAAAFSRRRFLALCALALGSPLVPSVFAQSRDPLAGLATERIGGTHYVDLRALAARLGWSVTSASAAGVVLASGKNQARFEPEEREFRVMGVRVYTGDAIRPYKRSLWCSRIDARAALLPVLNRSASGPRAPVRTICLDPGHGGKDPGTMNRKLGLMEKTFVLDLGMRLMPKLRDMGYRVVMTRTTDRFISLDERTAISNRAKADVFLSLHFNATQSESVAGTEQFVLTPQFQRSTSSGSSSASDNNALPGNRQDVTNTALGFCIHRRIVTGLKRTDRGLRRARFSVLRDLNCPGVLIEGAYLSNAAEAALIRSANWREQLAGQIALGVKDWAG